MAYFTTSNEDKLPIRESMHRTHYKESYDMKIYDQGTQNYKIVGRYVDRYLKKSIGKNYNKIKKHLLESLKNNNIARHENNLVEHMLSWRIGDTNGDTRLKEYIIDSQGRLQVNKKEKERTQYWIDKKKESKSTVSIDISNRKYYLREDITKKQIALLKTILVKNKIALGDWFDHLCNGGRINNEKYYSIVDNIRSERRMETKHGHYWCPETQHAKSFVESCFNDEGAVRHYYDYGSPEYRQWKKEGEKEKKKIRREKEKNRRIKEENLLHDIEAKRKAKEIAKDIIDRDRLGFDETSFKGEFYHGQKRKKR